MAIYIGTLGNDLINGSLSEDFILALAGKDTIFGGKGNDVINGDEGNDPTKQNQQDSTIYEGKDDDFLSGDEGNDTLFGEQGNDVILGGEGEDVGFGGDSNDWVNGNENNDTLHGNRGNDTVIGGEGNDLLYGGQDNDFLLGDRGNDTLSGDKGDDIVLAGIGNDLVFGGEGNDFLNGNENDDTIEGGNGNDTLHGGKESDRLFGGEGNDILIGDLGADTVSGGAGNDIFVIGRRNDVPGFLTTGGVNIIDADYFLDFTPDEDVIELIGNLQFSDLNIFAGTGIYANHTIIQDKGTNEYLAILKGVTTNSISSKNFLPITVNQATFLGSLEFSAANFSVNEDGTPIASITINRTNGDFGIISIKLLVNDGTAIGGIPPLAAPKDYDNSFITVTWADGDTTPKTVNIPIFNDTEIEGNETVNLTLSDPTNGAILGLQNTAVLTIIDNDTFIPNPGVLSFTKANYSDNEGNGGTVNKIVATIQRNNGSDGTVTVQVQLDTGSTATPNDFTNNLPITVTLLPGETSRNVEIPIIGDGIPEGNDTINLKLVNPTGGASLGGQQTATYTIINDDAAPTFDFSTATYTVTEGNGGSFNTNGIVRVNRTGDISGTNSIQIQLANGASPSATGGVDYNNTPITVTFNPGDIFKDVSVPIAGDTDVEQDENIALTLVNPSAGNVGTTTPKAVLTIINDDLATVSLTATDTKAAETGDTGTYRISRGTNTIGALTVNLNIDGSSLAKSTDYNLSGGSVTIAGSTLTVTIPDGQSFVDLTLTPNDDIHAEADETLKLNLAAGSYDIDGVNKEGTVAIAANDTVIISLADDASINPNYANLEGTLRQAMLNAEAFAGTDTINFSGAATSGTINLTGVLPFISQNLKINGTGAGNLNVRRDTGGEYRIFTLINGDFTIDGLTISNGLSKAFFPSSGGGILNFGAGTINVNNTTFSNNQSDFDGGAIANLNGGTVNVSNSTFTNNFADSGGFGGAIFNWKGGTVNVSKSTFSGNQSKNLAGGAIASLGIGTLTVTDSSFSDNKAFGPGGAIYTGGSLTVANSDFTNNKSDFTGGAIASQDTLIITKSTFSGNKSRNGGALSIDGTAKITDSTFSENTVEMSLGGAISITSKDTVTIDRTTLINNSANYGGAIWNNSIGTVKITNSTIANNTAKYNGGGVSNEGNIEISNSTISSNKANESGGGIYNASTTSTLNINQSTITNNTADFDSNDTGEFVSNNGGGIFIQSGTVTVKNTIVAANIDNSPFGGINPDFSGNLTSQGYNLTGNVGTQNFSSNTTGDLYGDPNNTTTKNIGATEFASAIDPKLNPLANNGGITQTHALLVGSPAINAGDPAFAPPPNTDQRGAGFDRILGGRIDIGAFESNFVPSQLQFSAPTFTVKEDGTAVAAVTVTRTNSNTGAVSATVTMNGGTAIGGATLAPPNDYKNTPITVNWEDGDSTPKTVTIPIFNDFLVEGDETVNLSLGTPTGGATIGAQNTATLTIKDMEGISLVTSGWQNIAIVPNNGDGTFGTPVEYSMSGSGNISAVTVADLNADGKLDLAAVNYPGNSISVRLNQGNGVFAPTVSYPVLNNNSPEDISSADLDGDGDIDLASSGLGGNVSVLLNNGNGTFGAVANYPGGTTPEDITIGDWDGDGDRDLATSSGNTPYKVTVLRNNGNGTFTPGGTFGVNANQEVTNADLDKDGDLDLISADFSNSNPSVISVLLNDGSGNFAAPVNYPVGSGPEEIAVGDIDGDSDLDLVSANFWNQNISVLLNNGDATFAAAVNYPVPGFTLPRSLTLGDFDADGRQDVVTANYSSLSLFRNNGNGTFAAAVNYSINSAVFVTTGSF